MQTNQNADAMARIRRLERELAEVRKNVGLSSATIDRGGLTLRNDAFIRMVDDLGVEIMYFGPDELGRQIVRLRREGGSDVLWTGFTLGGLQFWRLTDRFNNRELFSDDTENGGIARPWLSVPMYPLFSMPASTIYGYRNLDVATISTEKVLWEGRIPLVSHPMISISGIWGQASGSNTTTYRLFVNGTQAGQWAKTTIENSAQGPFNIAAHLDQTNVVTQLRAVATGSGLASAQVYGCWLRQT